MAYSELISKYGLTQQQLSEKVGKERATIANSLRILKLALPVREMVSKKEISMGHAKLLLSLENSKTQIKVAQKILAKGLSVRAAEQLIKKVKQGQGLSSMSSSQSDSAIMVKRMQSDLQKSLGTKVKVDYKMGKGKISINFYSDAELNKILELIKRNQ